MNTMEKIIQIWNRTTLFYFLIVLTVEGLARIPFAYFNYFGELVWSLNYKYFFVEHAGTLIFISFIIALLSKSLSIRSRT